MLTSGSLLAPPKLPGIAGFWVRLGAFVLDVLFLHFAVRLLVSLAGDLPFRHPDAATALSAALAFAYFIVCDSAIGARIAAAVTRSPAPVPTATLGKFLLGLRVTDLDGGIASARAAAIRYGILLGFVPLILVVGHFAEGSDREARQLWAYNMASALVGFAMLAGNAIACAFNAFKQGGHDFAAQTIVRKQGEEWLGFEALTTQLGDFWRMHYRQPQISAAVSAGLVYVSLGLLTWPKADSQDAAESYRAMWVRIGEAQARHPLLDGSEASGIGTDFGTAPPDQQTTPTLTLALFRKSLWTPAPDDPALDTQLRLFGQECATIFADTANAAAEARAAEAPAGQAPPARLEGTFTLRVTTESFVSLVVATARREHSRREFQIHLPPATRGS